MKAHECEIIKSVVKACMENIPHDGSISISGFLSIDISGSESRHERIFLNEVIDGDNKLTSGSGHRQIHSVKRNPSRTPCRAPDKGPEVTEKTVNFARKESARRPEVSPIRVAKAAWRQSQSPPSRLCSSRSKPANQTFILEGKPRPAVSSTTVVLPKKQEGRHLKTKRVHSPTPWNYGQQDVPRAPVQASLSYHPAGTPPEPKARLIRQSGVPHKPRVKVPVATVSNVDSQKDKFWSPPSTMDDLTLTWQSYRSTCSRNVSPCNTKSLLPKCPDLTVSFEDISIKDTQQPADLVPHSDNLYCTPSRRDDGAILEAVKAAMDISHSHSCTRSDTFKHSKKKTGTLRETIEVSIPEKRLKKSPQNDENQVFHPKSEPNEIKVNQEEQTQAKKNSKSNRRRVRRRHRKSGASKQAAQNAKEAAMAEMEGQTMMETCMPPCAVDMDTKTGRSHGPSDRESDHSMSSRSRVSMLLNSVVEVLSGAKSPQSVRNSSKVSGKDWGCNQSISQATASKLHITISPKSSSTFDSYEDWTPGSGSLTDKLRKASALREITASASDVGRHLLETKCPAEKKSRLLKWISRFKKGGSNPSAKSSMDNVKPCEFADFPCSAPPQI